MNKFGDMTADIAVIYDKAKKGHASGIKLLRRSSDITLLSRGRETPPLPSLLLRRLCVLLIPIYIHYAHDMSLYLLSTTLNSHRKQL